jgi:hypothetical protein
MRSGGLATRKVPIGVVLRGALVALLTTTLACGGPAARPPGPAAPLAGQAGPAQAGPVNVNERLVALTMDMAGLVTPYRVVGIRLGLLGELDGTASADRAAGADRLALARSDLDIQAWKVELVGAQRESACPDGACLDRFVFVQAYIARNVDHVIGITMRQLLPGDPSIPAR